MERKASFFKRRTQEEILEARSVSLNDLPHPKDEERVKSGKDEWLVMLGVCTHLGCVPLSNKGDYKGWFCPVMDHIMICLGELEKVQHLRIWKYQNMSLSMLTQLKLDKLFMSEQEYVPKSKAGKWFNDRLPLLSLASHLTDYPTPKNLNYWWTLEVY